MSTRDGESVEPVDTLAWHFHTHRVAHRGGTHETENGARGGNCDGPDREDYEAARVAYSAVVAAVANGGTHAQEQEG